MSLALVGDRKGIQLQNLRTNYPLMECIFPLLLSLLLSENNMVGQCQRMHGQGESRWKLANAGSPARMSVKPVCVCLCVK